MKMHLIVWGVALLLVAGCGPRSFTTEEGERAVRWASSAEEARNIAYPAVGPDKMIKTFEELCSDFENRFGTIDRRISESGYKKLTHRNDGYATYFLGQGQPSLFAGPYKKFDNGKQRYLCGVINQYFDTTMTTVSEYLDQKPETEPRFDGETQTVDFGTGTRLVWSDTSSEIAKHYYIGKAGGSRLGPLMMLGVAVDVALP